MFTKFFVDACVAIMICASAGQSDNSKVYDKYIAQCLTNLLYTAIELGVPCSEL